MQVHSLESDYNRYKTYESQQTQETLMPMAPLSTTSGVPTSFTSSILHTVLHFFYDLFLPNKLVVSLLSY